MCVCVRPSVKIVRIGHTLAKIKIAKVKFVDIYILPSNGVIAKIALHDRDLLLRSTILNIYISQTVRASAKIGGRHLQILTFVIEYCM